MTKIWQVLTSVFCSMLGIRSQSARERDFSSGIPVYHYIIAALCVCAGFVWLIITWVSYMLSS